MTTTRLAAPQIPGTTVISEKALVATATAVAAEVLAVPTARVQVRLSGNPQGLGCHVRGPMGLSAGPLLERAHQATGDIARLVTARTGRQVATVTVDLIGVSRTERRVR